MSQRPVFTFSASSGTTFSTAADWQLINNPREPGGLASFGVSVTGDPTSATNGRLFLALLDTESSRCIAIKEIPLTAPGTGTAGGIDLRTGLDNTGGYMMQGTGTNGEITVDMAGVGEKCRWYLGCALPTGATAMRVEAVFPVAFKS